MTVKKTTSKTRRAVFYIRMSSGKQEDSPEQQRTQLKLLLADRGSKFVREYCDDALSGSHDQRKRKAFHQMIADAETGKFDEILVWDTNRFGRFKPMEANDYWSDSRALASTWSPSRRVNAIGTTWVAG